MGRLEGKCALVTGGGRGIGAATALTLAREGARVGIMGKGETSLAKMKSDAAAQRLAIETFLGDVGSKDDAVRTVDAFVAKFGRIDVLVNNAGNQSPVRREKRGGRQRGAARQLRRHVPDEPGGR